MNKKILILNIYYCKPSGKCSGGFFSAGIAMTLRYAKGRNGESIRIILSSFAEQSVFATGKYLLPLKRFIVPIAF